MELGDAGDALPRSTHAADPVGHVSVCGVELQMRARSPTRDQRPPVLVMTNTVEQNLKSVALALCGVRHDYRFARARARAPAATLRRPWIRTHTGTHSWRKDNSRYPYEGARVLLHSRFFLLYLF